MTSPYNRQMQYINFIYEGLLKESGFKVLMVGEGADEVFSGYRRCLNYYLYQMKLSKKKLEVCD